MTDHILTTESDMIAEVEACRAESNHDRINVVHVSDRTYKDMLQGAEFTRWLDDKEIVGERIMIFDRHLDLTQHEVLKQDGRHVIVGPAIPWENPPSVEIT